MRKSLIHTKFLEQWTWTMGYLISNITDNECNEKEDDDNGREDVSDAEG